VRKLFLFRGLAAAMLLLGLRVPAYAWGAWAHEHINRGAVLSLPEPLRSFFYNHVDFMTEESVMPDVRKHLLNDLDEYPRHSIFLENYGPDALHTLPRTWAEAQRQFPAETLRKNGTLPWTIEEFTAKLTDAFRQRDKSSILFLAASLGHYIGDANVPLHTARNNNGQFSGQMDIHPLFEGQLVEMFGPGYHLNAGPAPYFPDVVQTTWQMISATHARALTLLQVDQDLRRATPEKEIYLLDANGRLVRNPFLLAYFTRSYAEQLHTRLGGMVEASLRSSVVDVAGFWNTAWVNAGRPDLSQLDPRSTTERNRSALQQEEALWREGRMFELQPPVEFDLARLGLALPK
jgi:hypothetical protein